MNKLNHSKITIDDRCLDLLLTEEEISTAFARSLKEENRSFIDLKECCACWPIKQPPQCSFWTKILGLCLECDCQKSINNKL